MSAPSEEGQLSKEERRSSVGRYMKRLKSVLRRSNSDVSKPANVSEEPVTATTAALPAETAVSPEEHSASATDISKPAQIISDPSKEPVVEVATIPIANVKGRGSYVRSDAQQERARSLFAKYGLTLDAYEWIATGSANTSVRRVEKPIRMRIRRTCHRCDTAFGLERNCSSCQHRRCQKCPRSPPKKASSKEHGPGETCLTGDYRALWQNHAPVLRIKTADGKELVRSPVRQCIRRSCHRCDALFVPPSRTDCANCYHTRCTKCPREPAKLNKYPDGYPGDAPASDSEPEPELSTSRRPQRVWRKPRQMVRWHCEECNTLFQGRSKHCQACGHHRGVEACTCRRDPPRPVRSQPPHVVASLEARLENLRVTDSPVVSTAA